MAGSEAGKPARGFHQSGKRTLAELLIIVFAIALLVLGLRACAGCLAGPIVSSLPPSVDEAMGKAAGESFRAEYAAGEAPTQEQQDRAARVFGELRSALTPDEARVLVSPRLTVARDAQVNAFALPGGEV